MNTVTNHVIETIGQLVIYRKQTLQHPFGDGKIYYTDKRDTHSREVGPFVGVHAAVEHWGLYMVPQVTTAKVEPLQAAVEFIEAPPAVVEPELLNNVIYVDFVAKKRRV